MQTYIALCLTQTPNGVRPAPKMAGFDRSGVVVYLRVAPGVSKVRLAMDFSVKHSVLTTFDDLVRLASVTGVPRKGSLMATGVQ